LKAINRIGVVEAQNKLWTDTGELQLPERKQKLVTQKLP
jgi:hypothetical protein